MKNALLFIWEVVKLVSIALLIVLPVRYFLFQPFIVMGVSMEPNFQDNNYLIIDRLSYRFREPKRGEVIVFTGPENVGPYYIKRIIGLPGETIQIKDGQVMILDEGKKMILNETNFLFLGTQTMGNTKDVLEENEFFVLGDNRALSFDSRQWGSLRRENIIGRVALRVWPFNIFEVPEISKMLIENYE